MEGLEADDIVASCAVQDNSVWPVPRWAGYSQRSFSIQSDVSLIGFPASNVAANGTWVLTKNGSENNSGTISIDASPEQYSCTETSLREYDTNGSSQVFTRLSH